MHVRCCQGGCDTKTQVSQFIPSPLYLRNEHFNIDVLIASKYFLQLTSYISPDHSCSFYETPRSTGHAVNLFKPIPSKDKPISWSGANVYGIHV